MTSPADVAQNHFAALLGADFSTDPETCETWGRDWSTRYAPAPLGVAFPRTVEALVEVVKMAREVRVGLVPSGGRTGLSGGAVAAQGELVVSTDRLHRVLDFAAADRQVHVQAGIVTQQLQAFADDQQLFYPVDFASSGSSQIGGNIATNAGGIKVIRYGMTRNWVAGLTVVTGAGDVLELNRGLVKNATGFDLRHLFVGSEGTLGFIVAADMQLTARPPEQAVLVLGVPEFADLLRVLESFRQRLPLSAFECFSDRALEIVRARHGHPAPFGTAVPFYALLEFDESAMEGALAVFTAGIEAGFIVDGVVSQSIAQAAALWRLREDISESLAPFMPYKNDVSVRISRLPSFIAEVDATVRSAYPDFTVVWFGHIGDGNLHLNVLRPEHLDAEAFFARCDGVSDLVFDIVRRHGGSISAEHGVGLLKRDYLDRSRSPAEIALFRSLKASFDPDGIMNPGKIFA